MMAEKQRPRDRLHEKFPSTFMELQKDLFSGDVLPFHCRSSFVLQKLKPLEKTQVSPKLSCDLNFPDFNDAEYQNTVWCIPQHSHVALRASR
jgi:hypothetical protein